MWTLSVNFQNDALNPEMRDAFADTYGWTGPEDPRGATKGQFRDYIIRQFSKDVVKSYRVKLDLAAQATRVQDPDVS